MNGDSQTECLIQQPILQKLKIYNFRNFITKDLKFDENWSFIIGNNGTGKTSILEAISILFSGKSFRTSKPDIAINYAHDIFSCIGFTSDDDTISVIRKDKKFNFRKNQINTKLPLIAKDYPLQIINTNVSDIFSMGSTLRRSFLDWICFYLVNGFADYYASYKKALIHRNALLKSKHNSKSDLKTLLNFYDEQLVTYGNLVNKARMDCFKLFKSNITPVIKNCFDKEIIFNFKQGWPDKPLKEVLSSHRDKDIAYGYTVYGAHKADIVIEASKHPVKEVLSRGQLKRLASLMFTSRWSLLSMTQQRSGMLLVDDIQAELDEDTLSSIFNYLEQSPSQKIITSIDDKFFQKEGILSRNNGNIIYL